MGDGSGRTSKSNAPKARKRVEVDFSATSSLKRAHDGSAFTRCDKCNRHVVVALIDFHDCHIQAQIDKSLDLDSGRRVTSKTHLLLLDGATRLPYSSPEKRCQYHPLSGKPLSPTPKPLSADHRQSPLVRLSISVSSGGARVLALTAVDGVRKLLRTMAASGGVPVNLSHGMADLVSYGNADRDIEQVHAQMAEHETSDAIAAEKDEFRKSYKEANPDCKSVATVAKEGGEKWKSMTDEEKKAYIDRAAELKAEYTKALKSNNEPQNADEEDAQVEPETEMLTVSDD
ncbi:high-mobility group box 6 [Actinidia rufa]|uniref:High-mobility group box 6 n=1 Tax=Actinidia rufa TaxID=165716 RepID=A0A7J0GY84_9ERIC|nr:high-mobility group box 6 [Actinidia rufa]